MTRSPASEIPPPMTTRSGTSTVDDVADRDPEGVHRLVDRRLAARVAGRGPVEHGLDRGRPGGVHERAGLGVGLGAAAVAAAAQPAAVVDRLVADLAARPRRPDVELAVDDEPAADPVPSVSIAIVGAPRPAPIRASASVWARASLMNATGMPRPADSRSRSG